MTKKIRQKIRMAATALAAAVLGLAALPMTAHAVPIISINDVTAVEGNSGVNFFDFTVSLSEASTETIRVRGDTADGTAFAGEDFSSVVGSIGTFTPGVTSLTFRVFVTGDSISELDETFLVNLTDPVNVTIGDGVGIGTILNDDGPLIAAPEPAPLGLFLVGLMAFGFLRRTRAAG